MSDNTKTTPPASGSGNTPVTCTTAPCGGTNTKCCGCAVSAVIQNVRPFFGDTTQQVTYGPDTMSFHNGHAFDFVMTFNYTAGTNGRSDASFEWNEKVNLPAHAAHPADTWTEMHTVGSPDSPIWYPWDHRTIPCPGGGAMTVTFTDPPSLGDAPGVNQTRTLDFRLVIKSGAGCGCAKNTITATARQILVMADGVIDETKSSFVIGATTET